MTERVSVIVNPAAGRGRAARMLPRVTAAFAGVGVDEILLTRSRGHETDLARDAIDRGATTLVVVGGDGTTTHVANAILNSGSDARLAILAAGTGNDFAKVLGTDNVDSITLARKAVEPGNTHVDVGKIEDHYFLNACGFGFDVAVLEGTLRRGWLRGNSVYLYAALTELFGYRGFDVRVSGETRRHMLIAIANTEFFGGMFRIAPGAQVSDGELDMVTILDLPPSRRISMLAAATKGTHFRFAECTMERARSFQLSFPSPPTYETDGELHSAASADLTVSSCPAALRVVTAPGP
jgi:diacylglycerol kinase (ATP)